MMKRLEGKFKCFTNSNIKDRDKHLNGSTKKL